MYFNYFQRCRYLYSNNSSNTGQDFMKNDLQRRMKAVLLLFAFLWCLKNSVVFSSELVCHVLGWLGNKCHCKKLSLLFKKGGFLKIIKPNTSLFSTLKSASNEHMTEDAFESTAFLFSPFFQWKGSICL